MTRHGLSEPIPGCYGGAMHIAHTRAELQAALSAIDAPALVPTMGALHEGHLSLVAAARAAGPVVASIFVNPLQFGPGEDLDRYPRDEAGDLRALAEAGCALVFLPTPAEIYPPGHATTIDVAGPALGYEGAQRPGHFRGVATVVARLLGLTRARTAWFGQKDWQQLQVIRRMVADLNLPVGIRDVPTARAPDGLALSSRNRFLSPQSRAIAACLPRIGWQAAAAARAGTAVATVEAESIAELTRLGFAVDYVAIVVPETLQPVVRLAGPARLIAAARLGSVRLLDNFPV